MSNELAIIDVDKNLAAFQVFNMDQDELAELQEDMGMGQGGNLGRFELPRIKMPSAGLLQFILPSGDTSKTVRGIIAAFKDVRVYFADPDSQGTPPSCTSEDCHCGYGMIHPNQKAPTTTECSKCPHNQWGSHPKGTGGKACSERRMLAIQTENGLVPTLLSLPVTSVKPVVEQMRSIVNQYGSTINNFILTLTLTEKMNSKGIKYAVVTIDPNSITPIAKELKATMKGLRLAAKAMLDSVPSREVVSVDADAMSDPYAVDSEVGF
jgi:hypothetical protein